MSRKVRFDCTNGGDPYPLSDHLGKPLIEACGEVIAGQDKMKVMVHEANGYGHYVCRCPKCGVEQHRKITLAAVEILGISGVERIILPEPRPKFMEPITDKPPILPSEVYKGTRTIQGISDEELYDLLTNKTEN